jgi:hypothetical protein
LCNDPFLPHPFQFINHLINRHHIVTASESFVT